MATCLAATILFSAYKLGNLQQHSLEEMAASPFQQQFGAAKANLSSRCQNCTWRFACHGGCRNIEFVWTAANGKIISVKDIWSSFNM